MFKEGTQKDGEVMYSILCKHCNNKFSTQYFPISGGILYSLKCSTCGKSNVLSTVDRFLTTSLITVVKEK